MGVSIIFAGKKSFKIEKMSADLRNVIEKVKDICKKNNISALETQITAAENIIYGKSKIEVAVLGQFKAGKSSFLNSLVGSQLLPVGVIPVTAIITKIKNGDAISAVIYRKNGTKETILADSVSEYVSESKNKNNAKQIDIVEISAPFPSGLEKFVLVDTPGIGSLHRNNSETTQSYIPETGYVFYLISADRPIGEIDITLISEIIRYCGELSIVITKIDIISETERAELIDYISHQVEHHINRVPSIFCYSIKKDEENYRNQIFEKIFKPLDAEYESLLFSLQKKKTALLIQSTLDYLNIAFAAIKINDEKKEMLAQIVEKEAETLSLTRKDLLSIAGSCMNETRPFLQDIFINYLPKIVEKMEYSFDVESCKWKGNLYKMTRLFENWLKKELSEHITVAVLENQEKIEEKLKESACRFERFVASFRHRLNENLLAALSQKLPENIFTLPEEKPQMPDISVSRVFDTPLDLLWFLFPMRFFRKIFLNYYKHQIEAEVEKNIFRTVSNLTEIINKKINSFSEQSIYFITREISTLNNFCLMKENSAKIIKTQIHEIEKLKDTASYNY